jgi:hypothetical protein
MAVVNLNQTEFLQARTDFKNNYFLENEGTDFTSEFLVKVTDLNNIVQNCGIETSVLGFQCIHRYDTGSAQWYQCLVCCTIAIAPVSPGASAHTIAAQTTGYIMRNTAGMPSTPNTESQDPDYFDNFYYSNGQQLSANPNFVQSNVMPWTELDLLLSDNGKSWTDANLDFKFASCSFQYVLGPIDWPHNIAVCLNENGSDLLDDTLYTETFKNKAADMGTACPPNCGVYIEVPMSHRPPKKDNPGKGR